MPRDIGSERVRVWLLGPIQVAVNGAKQPLDGPRRQALLAALALSPGEVVGIDQLVELIWAGAAPVGARNALQRHVSELRHRFGLAAAIVTRRPGYLLDLSGGLTDIQLAERLVERARQATGPREAAAALHEALDLWRGEPLVDLPGLAAPAERLARLRRVAEHALTEARLALGEHTSLGIDPASALRGSEAAIRRQDGALDLPTPTARRPPTAVPAHVPAALWERSATLASLEQLLAAGGRRIVLVTGEAGIGKSALVGAFAARCFPPARVLWGTCDPLVTPRALGPLHDIGRQTGGLLAARLDAGSTQPELLAALVEELSGQQTVVVLEDVHWADAATLDLLVFLARRVERLPALFVVTYRDDEVGPEHPLRTALAALPRQVVDRLSVPPLSPACVAEQAGRRHRDPAEVYRLTGGNPLLVTELLEADDPGVPATVCDLILARLRSLSDSAKELARLVAVMPTRADPIVCTGAEAQTDECVAAGVLVPVGDGVAYRHELLRRAVQDALSPARRAALHRQALALLAPVDGVDPARLVHHARQAGDGDAVLRYGIVAAAGAAAQGAHREAVAHYRAALAHAATLPAGVRAELLEAYSFQAYLAGVSAEALTVRRVALAERQALGEWERIGENLRWISRLAWWSGNGAEARAAAVQAVEVLRGGAPGRELAMAYSNRAQLHLFDSEFDAAVEWGERTRVLAERLGDRETAIHASISVGTARLARGDLAAAAALDEAHLAAAAAGLVDHAARALINRVTTLIQNDEWGDAARSLDAAVRYATEQDLDGYLQYLLGVRAGIGVERCEWDAALAAAAESLARPSAAGVPVAPALVAQARIQTARGDAAALSTLDEAAGHADSLGELQWIGPVAAARSQYFLLSGDPARAIDEARRGLRLATEKGHARHIGELTYRLWQAGEPTPVPPGMVQPAYRSLMAGDWRSAAAEWQRRGRGYARIEALARGDRPAIAEALRLLDGLGAVRAAEHVRADLRRRGAAVPRGPRAATAANVAGLTPRQVEVLGLLQEGLSTAAIAAVLFLSTKTVEHHISAVLEKLQVGSRAQAVAAAHRFGLTGRAS